MTASFGSKPAERFPVRMLTRLAEMPGGLPLLENLMLVLLRCGMKSTQVQPLSDEPFTIRDIQFQNP